MTVCTRCGTVGPAVKVMSGSFGVELALWCCFLLPGFIYSIWRLTTKRRVCGSCGADAMVGSNSPVGRKLIADLGGPTAAAPVIKPSKWTVLRVFKYAFAGIVCLSVLISLMGRYAESNPSSTSKGTTVSPKPAATSLR
jgi:hypothetical protein